MLLATWGLPKTLGGDSHATPFLLALLLLFLGYRPLAEHRTTGYLDLECGGADAEHGFTLVGALFIIPSSSLTAPGPTTSAAAR